MIHQWKRALLEGASGVFERGGKAREPVVDEATMKELHAKIGELAVANDPRSGRGQAFCPESSSPGPGSEARDDRQRSSRSLDRRAMPLVVDLALVLLLRAQGRDGIEPRC